MTIYNDTLIDPVVSVNILSSTSVFNNEIYQVLLYLSNLPLVHPTIIVNETVAINQVLATYQLGILLETLELLDTTSGSIITKDTLTDIITTLDSHILAFNRSITETTNFTETVVPYINNLIAIYELLLINSLVADKYIVYNSILNTITLLSNIGFIEKLVDIVAINNVVSDLYKVINTLVDTIISTDTLTNKYINVVSLSELFSTSESYASSLIGKGEIEDYFIIRLPELFGNASYLAYTLAPENMAITNYTNYNFTKCTKYKNKYLFSNSSGLYEYGASTDDGSVITAYIETAGLTFGTSNLKNVPSFYLGYSSTGASILRVRVDGKGTFHYKLNKYSNNLETKKMDIGKGLVGRYFQFEIITDADEFNLESMEFYPVVLKRKI